MIFRIMVLALLMGVPSNAEQAQPDNKKETKSDMATGSQDPIPLAESKDVAKINDEEKDSFIGIPPGEEVVDNPSDKGNIVMKNGTPVGYVNESLKPLEDTAFPEHKLFINTECSPAGGCEIAPCRWSNVSCEGPLVMVDPSIPTVKPDYRKPGDTNTGPPNIDPPARPDNNNNNNVSNDSIKNPKRFVSSNPRGQGNSQDHATGKNSSPTVIVTDGGLNNKPSTGATNGKMNPERNGSVPSVPSSISQMSANPALEQLKSKQVQKAISALESDAGETEILQALTDLIPFLPEESSGNQVWTSDEVKTAIAKMEQAPVETNEDYLGSEATAEGAQGETFASDGAEAFPEIALDNSIPEDSLGTERETDPMAYSSAVEKTKKKATQDQKVAKKKQVVAKKKRIKIKSRNKISNSLINSLLSALGQKRKMVKHKVQRKLAVRDKKRGTILNYSQPKLASGLVPTQWTESSFPVPNGVLWLAAAWLVIGAGFALRKWKF